MTNNERLALLERQKDLLTRIIIYDKLLYDGEVLSDYITALGKLEKEIEYLTEIREEID